MIDNEIWVTTWDDSVNEPVKGAKGIVQNWTNKIIKPIPVDPEILKQEWIKTMRTIRQLIQLTEKEKISNYSMQLEEVTLAVEINGKGNVSLIGVSGEANGKGAITLKFKRLESKQNG